jgi:hypothetical protein
MNRKDIVLAGAADSDEKSRKKIPDDNNCKFFTDAAHAMDELKPDFVLNATPPDSHKIINDFAFDRSIPVLCEKPTNVSVEVDGCSALITWEEPENIDGVLLYYKLYFNGYAGGGVYEYPQTVIITATPNFGYSGIPCTVQLSAVYEHCPESDLTDEINFVLCDPQLCEPPQNLAAVLEDNCCFAMITWDKPENIDGILLGYNVIRDGEQLNNEPVVGQEYRDTVPIALRYIITYQISAVYEHCNSNPTDGIELDVPWSVGNYQDASINIFPNPTSGELYVASDELHVTNIEIFDIYGRKQISDIRLSDYPASEIEKSEIQKSENRKSEINITHLPAGVYFIKIYTKSGETVKKIVKI